MNNIKTYLIIILIVVAVAVLFTQLVPGSNDDESITIEPYDPVVTETDFSEMPEGFPVGLITEDGAPVVLNNVEEHPTGTKAVQVYITKRAPADNLGLYQNWLLDNDWALISLIDEETKIINAEKGNQTISITISTHQSTGEKIVEISVLTKK